MSHHSAVTSRKRDSEEESRAEHTQEKQNSHSLTLSHNDFTVGWVCGLPKEQTAARAMLDNTYPPLNKPPNDPNAYTLGSIGSHNVVIVCLPKGVIGTNSAATFVTQMTRTFPSVRIGLMVGIGGGIPPKVRLGDVVVGTPNDQYPGVVQWDFGKAEKNHFTRIGSLDRPPSVLLAALTQLESDNEMKGSKIPKYLSDLKANWPRLVAKYTWSDARRDPISELDVCARGPEDVCVHYGLIASGNQLIKDAKTRDSINQKFDGNILCFEMEAAGLINFPCITIRGICDYADSSMKIKDWEEYAAATAAAFAKELLSYVQPADLEGERSLMELLDQINDDLCITQKDVAYVKSELNRGADLDVLNWLTTVNYGATQSDYFKLWQPGTGEWFLESEEFQSWLAGTNQTLFCPGIPGSGKTIITSIAVNYANLKFNSNPEVGIAYVYCNHQRENQQDTRTLLLSILRQLTQCLPSLPKSLSKLYEAHNKKRTYPSVEEVFETLKTVTKTYEKILIFMDALDECQMSNNGVKDILDKLFDIQRIQGINIFATSRSIPHITDIFKGVTSIEVHARNEDVTRYINRRIKQLPAHIQGHRDLKQEIATGILEAVEGMFLLAQIYISLLDDKMTPNEVRSSLELFKRQRKGRDDTEKVELLYFAYGQAMERINRRLKGHKSLALNVLIWVTYAKTQLTALEVQHALATKPGKPELDLGDIPQVVDMISVCVGLVAFDKASGVVRLVHYTTQEFLKNFLCSSSWCPQAESTLGATCVSYLSFKEFETGSCHGRVQMQQRCQKYPFYKYAAKNWGYHPCDDNTGSNFIITFLQNDGQVEASGQVLLVPEAMPESNGIMNNRDEHPRNLTGLHLAAFFGITPAVASLLKSGCDPNIVDAYNRTPIWYAARKGHIASAKLLLSAGADSLLSARANSDWNRVIGSTLRPREKPETDGPLSRWLNEAPNVQELFLAISNIIDLSNAPTLVGSPEGYSIKTPLCAAVSNGCVEMVETLLSAGACPNTNNGGSPAIVQAAQNSDLEVVEILINAGAWVDIDGGRALCAAVQGGSSSIVERLLSAGADPNICHDSQLEIAASRGCLDIVESLIAAKANINGIGQASQAWALEMWWSTPLISAARKGHLKIVERLIEGGADCSVPDSFGITALQAAITAGEEQVVKRLQAARADSILVAN
ncbi:unnamed protein product [Clonostachys solani]|uniref:Nucleoside phosphorylase domain-containing protein n=1 Tax=Clonostachys solani TaxID=160281 RepID=A0A9N9VVY4_9HYPO|nr:unnamed protein product [Clonostachys solani]